ncbi:MAG: RdgB/HAM1 family non-canonical purine NTP pyrophosphatase [Eggerthellaceae bacterium]|nr:RdgB/HAM1 family non-canonical purine NTP pyrophosphatase [Eggerthellaceae bacterium]
MRRVIIATNNIHKVKEIKTALNFEGWEFCTLNQAGISSDPDETSDTFLGNSRIKAYAAWDAAYAKYGYPCAVLADDSGLEVDALNGVPGVYSSRYAGMHGEGADKANNLLLLNNLESVPFEQRTGRFVCTLVFLDEDKHETDAYGSVEGKIGFEERGEGGFGYDPLFYPDKYNNEISFAEVSQDEKNLISHRGNALRLLKSLLTN